MELSSQRINGSDFSRMMLFAAERLRRNVEQVNALNVFPVPDGDTGTNMNLTLTTGVQEMQKKGDGHLGRAAEALSKGLLMGARGNSGVILSQLFRGFAKTLAPHEEADVQLLSQAFLGGVETAYKAVVKPVEGTILTVSKDAAEAAAKAAQGGRDLAGLLEVLLEEAKAALARTPDQLPILKQVGVVDAGGQGLVFIYEGFLKALKDPLAKPQEAVAVPAAAASAPAEAVADFSRDIAQAHIATEAIEFGYCTEFIVQLHEEGRASFKEEAFREELSAHGDSMVVVADDDLVKVHIHAEYPGNVLNLAMRFGALTRIKIDNMREQHTELLSQEGHGTQPGHAPAMEAEGNAGTGAAPETAPKADVPRKAMGMVAVAAGPGLEEVFRSIGVDVMLSGGQTMNPSTEDIVKAIRDVPADTVFVLPNNSNIVLAARQAAELTEQTVIVIPTKTIPQGLSAALAFNEFADAAANEQAMAEAAGQVRSGSVTYAVRDSSINGLDIREGDYLGMLDSDIAAHGPDLDTVLRSLLDRMLENGDEIVTIFAGQDADEARTEKLVAYLEERYPDVELELHQGGQPIYSYLISAES